MEQERMLSALDADMQDDMQESRIESLQNK